MGQKDGSCGRAPKADRAGNVPLDNPRGAADYFRSGYGIDDGQYHPAAFPTMSCLAMSWDEDLAKEAGRVFALCDRLEDVPACTVDLNALHKEAQEAAEQCIVLLKNDGMLPLSADTEKKLLVVGSLAENPSYYGGGSGHMNGYIIDKPLEEIRKIAAGPVDYAKGYETKPGWPAKASVPSLPASCSASPSPAGGSPRHSRCTWRTPPLT